MDGHRYSTLEIRRSAVQAVLGGLTVAHVAAAYCIDPRTIFRWLRRHRAHGSDGLQRKPGSGRPRLLSELTPTTLLQLVLRPAAEFGFESDLWTVSRLRHVIAERHGVRLSDDTVWRRLRDAGLTYQKPERHYFEADPEVRRHWLRYTVPIIRRKVREMSAILYFQDESNVSLSAFLGKTWSPRGRTPSARVTGARGGVSAMSALSGSGRLLFAMHDKRITSEEVIGFLEQMLKHHPCRSLVVVMDQAPPHVSRRTRAFIAEQDRLTVFYLPKYSPDLNPDEKVWNHLKHHELKSHQARTKEELKELAQQKLQKMANNPALLHGLFFRCCVADFFG